MCAKCAQDQNCDVTVRFITDTDNGEAYETGDALHQMGKKAKLFPATLESL